MNLKRHKLSLILVSLGLTLAACSSKNTASSSNQSLLSIDLGADVSTLDPQMSEDTQSHRVINDTFEGLTSYDQANKIIPGLASSWEISTDGKTYTFHLRPGIKFSDGSPITARDVVFTFRRLVDPKTSSPYNMLGRKLINGDAVIAGKAPLEALGIQALDQNTVQIQLVNPDAAFLAVCSLWNLGIVSEANVTKFGGRWTDPKNMVTSGAYKVSERVVKGYILESKNPYYYAESSVAVAQVKLVAIEDNNSALSQYKSDDIQQTYSLPVDQYTNVKTEYPQQEHTVSLEGMYYYDFNMTSAKFKNNLPLRQALSMAVDRVTLTTTVLGQGQVPLYAYATNTVEGGKFAGLDYPWAKWPREQQIAKAKELFKTAGYDETHPLSLTINYNTNDSHKKAALAITSMWQQVFGSKSVTVTAVNQEWKTFLQARHKGDYDIARDAWIADYDSIDSYTNLYQCNNPQNNAHSCNPTFDKLLAQAQASTNAAERRQLTSSALSVAMNDYSIIPLYQYTYYRLLKPQVGGYVPENNHLDHVMSKWYTLKP